MVRRRPQLSFIIVALNLVLAMLLLSSTCVSGFSRLSSAISRAAKKSRVAPQCLLKSTSSITGLSTHNCIAQLSRPQIQSPTNGVKVIVKAMSSMPTRRASVPENKVEGQGLSTPLPADPVSAPLQEAKPVTFKIKELISKYGYLAVGKYHMVTRLFSSVSFSIFFHCLHL